MPEEKKAPEVQEPPHQWNTSWDRWHERELNNARPNGISLSSPESTCTTVVPKKADAQGNGEQEYDTAAGGPTESISSSDEGSSDDDAEGFAHGFDRHCDRQCDTERGSSSDDDMQGSPLHPRDSSAGNEPTFGNQFRSQGGCLALGPE